MIRFSCPSCKKGLNAQDHEAGTKLHCPHCNQRLQVPASPVRVPSLEPNKTVLGQLEEPTNKTVLGKIEEPTNKTVLGTLENNAGSQSGFSQPKATCPGCGRTIRLEPHEWTWNIECAKCKTTFIPANLSAVAQQQSVASRKEDVQEEVPDVIHVKAVSNTSAGDLQERPSRRSRGRPPCPRCGSAELPRLRREITTLSIVLLVVFIWVFPLCLLALLLTEEFEYCVDCGEKMRSRGTGFGLPN